MNQSQKPTVVSTYDRVNGLLVSSIMIVGFVVLSLFLIWLTMTATQFSYKNPGPMFPVSPDQQDPYSPIELALVQTDDFPHVDSPDLDRQLTLVQHAVSSVRAQAPMSGNGDTWGFDKREKGGREDDGESGQASRWQIRFVAKNATEYAQQLDFFGIEIGAIDSESARIVRISEISNNLASKETDRKSLKSQLYFINRSKQMRRWEANFAGKAGVSMQNMITSQLYPEVLRNQLLAMEIEAAKEAGADISRVKRTWFDVVPTATGYEFVVSDMTFFEADETTPTNQVH